MNDRETIQNYINNFRRRLSKFLKPNIGLSCNVYPSEGDGAILEFTIGSGIANVDNYRDISESVGKSLESISQHAFGGNLSGFKFSGTNMILEDRRIIFIKGEERAVWRDDAAQADIDTLVSKLKESAK